MEISLSATVSDSGELRWESPARLLAWLLGSKGQRVTVTLERASRRRTSGQNARLWSALYPFIGEMMEQRTQFPWSKEMVHELCCRAFLGTVEVEVGGEIHQVRKASRKLTTTEFSQFMQRVEAWIQESWNINPALIENPDEIA